MTEKADGSQNSVGDELAVAIVACFTGNDALGHLLCWGFSPTLGEPIFGRTTRGSETIELRGIILPAGSNCS
jgi:hypothetical protein